MRKIAESTVRRLSLYLRFLEEFEEQGIATASSDALATRGGTTSAQVRKDLSFFGSFGKRGLGYAVPALAAKLRDILGLKQTYRVVVIGAGKIGGALVRYKGFAQRGFAISAVTVKDAAQFEGDLKKTPADIAIVAVPAESAQAVVDRVVKAGIKAVLNFAP